LSSPVSGSSKTGPTGDGEEAIAPLLGYAMELCVQGTVAELLRNVGFVDEGSAAWLICDVLTALAYLHKQRIVHRDIKASNMLLVDGVVKVSGLRAHILTPKPKLQTPDPQFQTPNPKPQSQDPRP
jgi:serine/threonine protein kinase